MRELQRDSLYGSNKTTEHETDCMTGGNVDDHEGVQSLTMPTAWAPNMRLPGGFLRLSGKTTKEGLFREPLVAR
ncbi:hypothetical protein JZ785_12920 [Alicyclobacillus curvatus]|jgi:hypothetical protein|nr:hypothetical protein JZ785_12920 [Alicyclobacillus curvatus]